MLVNGEGQSRLSRPYSTPCNANLGMMVGWQNYYTAVHSTGGSSSGGRVGWGRVTAGAGALRPAP